MVDECRRRAQEADPRANVYTISGNVLEVDDPIVGRVRLTFEVVADG